MLFHKIYVFVINIVFIIIINERRTFMEILFISTIAGLLQGLTGFGAGIILMLYLPYLYPVIQCSGIIGIICLFLSLIMALQYRKFIKY